MTTDPLGSHQVPEGIDESAVGMRLLIKHTVPMDVYVFLDNMAHEEGKQLDDIYLRIMNTAIIETMRKAVADRVANARIQAALAASPRPGPKPKVKVKVKVKAKPKRAPQAKAALPVKPAKAKSQPKVKAAPAPKVRKAAKKKPAAKKSQAVKPTVKPPAVVIAQPASKAPAGPRLVKRTPRAKVRTTD